MQDITDTYGNIKTHTTGKTLTRLKISDTRSA